MYPEQYSEPKTAETRKMSWHKRRLHSEVLRVYVNEITVKENYVLYSDTYTHVSIRNTTVYFFLIDSLKNTNDMQ